MELWAQYAHKALWHDFEPGWKLHKSHHVPRTGPFEDNDVFAIINAVPAMGLCAFGFLTPGVFGGAQHFFTTTFTTCMTTSHRLRNLPVFGCSTMPCSAAHLDRWSATSATCSPVHGFQILQKPETWMFDHAIHQFVPFKRQRSSHAMEMGFQRTCVHRRPLLRDGAGYYSVWHQLHVHS